MLITATPELLSFAAQRGGSLVVRCQRQHLCRGVSFLVATTVVPPSLAGYELFVVDGTLVLTRFPGRRHPQELQLSLEGHWRKRPVAAWDGCAFVV